MQSPRLIDGMDVAVQRLIQAYKNNESVGLYGDYDLDGTPGLALLKRGLNSLGFEKLHVAQPLRLKEGYGVHKSLIDELKAASVSLVITVDVGITDVEAIEYANSQGIDVVITDHHLPKEQLPEAVAILNPNKGTCESGLGHLCGTGVAFYLMVGLKQAMEKEGLPIGSFKAKDLLDLFAIATVTDMVPLVEENRALVKHGLKVLENTQLPGLRALMKQLDLYGRELSAQDISFKLAPKLNACSRLEEGLRPLDVFMADEEEAHRLAEEVISTNQRRQNYQKQAEKLAKEIIEAQDNRYFVAAFSKEFHPGVVSVVANKLMEQYQRPCFIGAIREGGQVVGSSRSPWPHVHLPEVMGQLRDCLEKFGGHAMAAGFETSEAQLGKFQQELDRVFRESDFENRDSGSMVYDCELHPHEVNESLMKWQGALEPFGQGFEQPRYLLRDMEISEAKSLKNGHMRFRFQTLKGLEAPWFGAKRSFKAGERVHFVFEPQWNHWMGRRRMQLLVQDMWSC